MQHGIRPPCPNAKERACVECRVSCIVHRALVSCFWSRRRGIVARLRLAWVVLSSVLWHADTIVGGLGVAAAGLRPARRLMFQKRRQQDG